MRWATLLAAGCAATMALAAGADAMAQAGPRGGGDGFRGGPPAGGGYHGRPPGAHPGGPPPGGGYRPPHAHYPRGGVYLGFYPGTWWGPGYWPGAWWGPGYWGPRYGYDYPPPYYGGYPPAYVAPAPPVYVERDAPSQPVEPVWWYWCGEANAYYPYVKECPGGWRRVPPQPVPERQ